MTAPRLTLIPARAPWGLAVLFGAAGALHLGWPGPFTRIVPPWLPTPLLLVYASGVAALVGAAAVIPRRTRRLGGWWLLAFLAAVFPANVQMLLAARAGDAARAAQVLLWLRLPLQLLLAGWVWRAAVRPRHPALAAPPD